MTTPVTVTITPGSKTFDTTTDVTSISFELNPSTHALSQYLNTNVTASMFQFNSSNAGLLRTVSLKSGSVYPTSPDYAITWVIATSSITKATIPVEVTAVKTYDGNIFVSTGGFSAATTSGGGLFSYYTQRIAGNYTAANFLYDTKNVGFAKSLTPNFTITDPNVDITNRYNAIILATALTVRINDIMKIYDGTPTAISNGVSYSGLVDGDTASALTTTLNNLRFASKNVGSASLVYDIFTTTGPSYYSITNQTGIGTINKQTLTASGVSANNKTYDGTASAVASGVPILYGIIDADSSYVSATATAIFGDENVGVGKTVTVTYSLSGTEAGNYEAPPPTMTSANISAKLLTASDVTANNKVYDGTTVATTTGTPVLQGIVGSESVTASVSTAAFADAAVGTNKPVTVTFTLSGADKSNYNLSNSILYADITEPQPEPQPPTPTPSLASPTTNTSASSVTSHIASINMRQSKAQGTFKPASYQDWIRYLKG